MKIASVSQVFSQIEETSSRTEITQMLAGLLVDATATEAKELCYLFLGELYPPYKPSQYAIAQKMMLKIVGRALDVSEYEIQKKMARVGDVGSLVEQEEWDAPVVDLSVSQVYKELVALEVLSGTGSQEKKNRTYGCIVAQIRSSECKICDTYCDGNVEAWFFRYDDYRCFVLDDFWR